MYSTSFYSPSCPPIGKHGRSRSLGGRTGAFCQQVSTTNHDSLPLCTSPPNRRGMNAVAWFLQIPPNPRRTISASCASNEHFLFRFMRSSVRASGDNTTWQMPLRTVSWNTHVEIFRQTSRSVSWNTHVEVFTIPARNDNFEDDAFSCEDDTLTPCTVCSDGPKASDAIMIKRDPLD